MEAKITYRFESFFEGLSARVMEIILQKGQLLRNYIDSFMKTVMNHQVNIKKFI